MRLSPRLLTAIALASTAACRYDAADDAFARTFIANVRSGDSAGARQLQANSKISSQPWPEFTAKFRAQLPAGGVDTVELLEWEHGRDDEGKYRKLTYALKGQDEEARAEVWLVTQDGHTVVNTLRIVGSEEP
jgi:hypothetical protein